MVIIAPQLSRRSASSAVRIVRRNNNAMPDPVKISCTDFPSLKALTMAKCSGPVVINEDGYAAGEAGSQSDDESTAPRYVGIRFERPIVLDGVPTATHGVGFIACDHDICVASSGFFVKKKPGVMNREFRPSAILICEKVLRLVTLAARHHVGCRNMMDLHRPPRFTHKEILSSRRTGKSVVGEARLPFDELALFIRGALSALTPIRAIDDHDVYCDADKDARIWKMLCYYQRAAELENDYSILDCVKSIEVIDQSSLSRATREASDARSLMRTIDLFPGMPPEVKATFEQKIVQLGGKSKSLGQRVHDFLGENGVAESDANLFSTLYDARSQMGIAHARLIEGQIPSYTSALVITAKIICNILSTYSSSVITLPTMRSHTVVARAFGPNE